MKSIRKKTCERCNVFHDGSYGSGRFCSSKCARGFSTSKCRCEINQKVSTALTEEFTQTYCDVCLKKLRRHAKTSRCRRHLQQLDSHKQKISRACKGRTGGYRKGSGYHRSHGSMYNGIWMDSTWELRFATLLDEVKIKWERGDHLKMSYFLRGVEHKYHPDFYLPSSKTYIEIKGRWTVACKRKMRLVEESNPMHRIQYLNSIKEIDEYVADLIQR